MTFIYVYGLAKMSITWPAAGSCVHRLGGTKEIGFSKNFVSDNAPKYPDNATTLQATLFINHLTPNGYFSGRTALLTYRCCIF
jgi:hypothetical protein